MALTAETIQGLLAKQFDTFYKAHERKWKDMVKSAEKYVRTYLPAGKDLHPGDISAQLVIPLRIDGDFVKYTQTKKLTQKHWSVDFADYIVEQIHPTKI